MTIKLKELLQRKLESDYDKLRSAYERLFFTRVTPHLNKIYTLAYADVLTGLQENLSQLTPTALAMDNEVIVCLFKDTDEVFEDASPATG